MKGFLAKWISWIKSFVISGSVAVNVNDDVEHSTSLIEAGKCICQRYLKFSPLQDFTSIPAPTP
jgi:hypothetical protein